jgi:hypothetical protein
MRNEWVRLTEILRWAVTAHLRTIFEQPSGGIGRHRAARPASLGSRS